MSNLPERAAQRMMRTPDTFVPLLTAQAAQDPLNFLFRGDEILIREEDLALPDEALRKALGVLASEPQPVGLLEGRYGQAGWLLPEATAPAGWTFRKLRSLFSEWNEGLLAVAGRSYQIAEWSRTHRFCGACGSPTVHVAGERCVRCPNCGHSAYPRISPAMMVLIRDGDRVLLARHNRSPSSFFTALAGFLEAGESVEEAIHREVFEEVGLTVRNLRYFDSQPWPFPHSLMLAFTADYAGGEIRVDETEIAEARWFGPGDTLPRTPMGISIASHLIAAHWPAP